MAVLGDLILEPQKSTNWCWAAVTLAICRFLGDTGLTQEGIVCTTLGDNTCSLTPTPSQCNIPFPLETVLDRMRHFDSIAGVLPFDDLRREIDEKRHPIAISLLFVTDLGVNTHYCLIKGCEVAGGVEEITLLDPSPATAGESQIPYQDLCSGSILGAPWAQSFTVR
jgi:hypothetical protein